MFIDKKVFHTREKRKSTKPILPVILNKGCKAKVGSESIMPQMQEEQNQASIAKKREKKHKNNEENIENTENYGNIEQQ